MIAITRNNNNFLIDGTQSVGNASSLITSSKKVTTIISLDSAEDTTLVELIHSERPVNTHVNANAW